MKVGKPEGGREIGVEFCGVNSVVGLAGIGREIGVELVGFGVDVTRSAAGVVVGDGVGVNGKVFGVGETVDDAATSGGIFRFQIGNFLPGSVSFISVFWASSFAA